MLRKLSRNRLLRRVVLPLLSRFNPGDVTITHHHTGDRVRLHSYRHKGYWFHGRHREQTTMDLFRQLLPAGATVLEMGGHIGYVSLYLAHLVGPQGRIYVFEPGPNNLPYLRQNVGGIANIVVVEKGAGPRTELRSFYMESLTGQNNSFVKDFAGLKANRNLAYDGGVHIAEIQVEVISPDDFVREQALRPDLVKIDVEGFEWDVLQGAQRLLHDIRPMLMVEIQAHQDEILRMLHGAGYEIFRPVRDPYNHFALHTTAHREVIQRLGLHTRTDLVVLCDTPPLTAGPPLAAETSTCPR